MREYYRLTWDYESILSLEDAFVKIEDGALYYQWRGKWKPYEEHSEGITRYDLPRLFNLAKIPEQVSEEVVIWGIF